MDDGVLVEKAVLDAYQFVVGFGEIVHEPGGPADRIKGADRVAQKSKAFEFQGFEYVFYALVSFLLLAFLLIWKLKC